LFEALGGKETRQCNGQEVATAERTNGVERESPILFSWSQLQAQGMSIEDGSATVSAPPYVSIDCLLKIERRAY